MSSASPVVDDSGRVLPETYEVLRRIARHNTLLATGHLSRDGIFAVVDAAREVGITKIVITHPDFASQTSRWRPAGAGAAWALLERCMTPPLTKESLVGDMD